MHDISFLTHSVGSADRIHIIGGPGAGKSTLARRLGATLGLPVHTLDTVAYEGPEFTARSREAAESGLFILPSAQGLTLALPSQG